MKYVITKNQVEEMYKEVVGMWRFYRDNTFTLTLYKNKNNKIEWAFIKGDPIGIDKDSIIFEMEQEGYGIFEAVVLKEIGGRRGYTKKEIIDGIQWNIHNNYLRSAAQ